MGTKKKSRNTRSGKTTRLRATLIKHWVEVNYIDQPAPPHLTTEAAAQAAEETLGFPVSQNRIAREFYRRGVAFEKRPGDPPPPSWSRGELTRVRVDALERRVGVLEKMVRGESKKAFSPRSSKETKKASQPAPQQ